MSRETPEARRSAAFTLDGENAFNLLDRLVMLVGVRLFLPGLYCAARLWYGHFDLPLPQFHVLPSPAGPTSEVVASWEGVQQGDAYGPCFFSAGIHDDLSRLR